MDSEEELFLKAKKPPRRVISDDDEPYEEPIQEELPSESSELSVESFESESDEADSKKKRKTNNGKKRKVIESEEEEEELSSEEEDLPKKRRSNTKSKTTKKSSDNGSFKRAALGLRNKKAKVNYNDKNDWESEEEEEKKPKNSNRKNKKKQESDNEEEEEDYEIDKMEEEEPKEVYLSEEPKTIEKILSMKQTEANEVQYLVKWKGKSYLHLEWVPSTVFDQDRFSKQKLLRYLKSREVSNLPENEIYNEDFVEIDRIFAKRTANFEGKTKLQYYVKWQSMQYNESTWEDAEIINDDEKLRLFTLWNRTVSYTHLTLPTT
eukprot:TRINITY_DN10952_c0_g1_i1.p1 TRINITY_DN10952_c0_g1~~TRINITY_DN10952_c0_g1_i1.p1  ORF type:complete len:321 (-),score=110.74 TRINITY_DN10952_c0_g1_i1:20-982(-)